jgi:hypothetical protein
MTSTTAAPATMDENNGVVVQPSFDADDPAASSADARLSSKPEHRRDLSAHFLDATRLTDDDTTENTRDYPVQQQSSSPWHQSSSSYHTKSSYAHRNRLSPTRPDSIMAFSKAATSSKASPAHNVGSKHRRGFSGGVSNPNVAHRRINSIGDSAQVDRFGYYNGGSGGGYSNYHHHHNYAPSQPHRRSQHRREDSAGLDILSAVADESKEQLEMAAGRNQSWERRMDPPQPVTSNYDYPSSYSSSGYSNSGGYSASSRPGMHYYQHAPPSSHPLGGSAPPQPNHHQHSAYAPPPPSRSSQSPYPVQYAPLKDSHYRKSNKESSSEPLDTDERLFQNKSSDWRGGRTTAVQTFVTALDHGSRTVMPAPSLRNTGTNTEGGNATTSVGHHRKLSSYSSLGGLMGSALFPDPEGRHEGRHHRSTSSSISLLQGLESESDLFFLQNTMQGPPRAYSPSYSAKPTETTSSHPVDVVSHDEGSGHSLAAGGTSKRIRRKCTVGDCRNRVVQGGLCISHGAKRKTCKHHGCNKNVKKAGLCSTHGPARKRCENDNCNKVAVQGGRCIAHGAKKKLCEFNNCTKQAILAGMCKKHHDMSAGSSGEGGNETDPSSEGDVANEKPVKAFRRPSHARGLSIFQEISAESVQTLLSAEEAETHPLKQDQVHPLKGK